MSVIIDSENNNIDIVQEPINVTISTGGADVSAVWGNISGDLTEQEDLQAILDEKVPYTGATQDVNLGEFGAQVGNLEFDTTPTNTPTGAGSVYWSDTDGTLNLVLKGGQTISRIGETQHIRALNNTGVQIARGKVVYVVGAQGQRLTIALADADTEILSKDTIGFTSEAIADGAEGFVIVQGVINNISTTGMTDGATVYLSQTAGGYTTTPPPDPAHLVILGFIVNGGSGGAGSIYVKVDNGYELEELHNISDSEKATAVDADAVLLRDSADNNLWKRLTWANVKSTLKTYFDTLYQGTLTFDNTPTNGSTNPVTSDGVFDALALKQDNVTLTTTGTSGAATLVGSALNIPQYQAALTNPVTGTGVAGQVSYWSGTNTQTGSSNLFWDAANSRLGIGTSTPLNTYAQSQLQGVFARYEIRNSNANQNIASWDVYSNTLVSPDFFGRTAFKFEGGINNASRQYQIYVSDISTPKIVINGSGNLLINSIVDAGQRLQVYGSTLLRGSGTTSSTTALLVQNSAATELLKVLDNGAVSIPLTLTVTGNIQSFSNGVFSGYVSSGGGIAATTGNNYGVYASNSFQPTSGTATYAALSYFGTINQTGGANGITRGLYVNPTLTAAADWRSVEFSNNTGWGLYGAGTANNYLAGSLGIGSTSLTNYALRIGKSIAGNISSVGLGITSTISSAVTSSASLYLSLPSTQAASFTLSQIRHFEAGFFTLGEGSSITNQYGFFCGNLTQATNNYGFYGDIASGTGRWNLYMNGTAANYLAGNTSIGTTTSSGRLTVQGSGTTSATKALVVNNSTPTAIFEILDNGRINQTIQGTTANTIFGSGAGASASLSGSNNTFFGEAAGQAVTTAGGNTLIGQVAGGTLTTGGSNVYIGRSAGGSNQTAVTNTAVGTFIFLNHTTGDNNIGQGFNAARFYADGTTSATSFSGGVYFGAGSKVSAAGVTNEIVIGFNAIGNGSNTATLGSTSITNTYLRGNINYTDGGNFVIGTTTGTKIGTATSQKIGLWNATPIVQPTTAVAAATRVGGGGTTVTDTDTFDGYTIAQLVKALRNMGALA